MVGESDGAGLVVGKGVFIMVGLNDRDGAWESVGATDGIGVILTDGDNDGAGVTSGPNGSM